jgi:hypothetical protein
MQPVQFSGAVYRYTIAGDTNGNADDHQRLNRKLKLQEAVERSIQRLQDNGEDVEYRPAMQTNGDAFYIRVGNPEERTVAGPAQKKELERTNNIWESINNLSQGFGFQTHFSKLTQKGAMNLFPNTVPTAWLEEFARQKMR